MNKTATQLLYKSELTPLVGSLPDRIRVNDPVYEFGSVNHTFTLIAASEKIAIAAILLISDVYFPSISRPLSSYAVPYSDKDGGNMFGTFGNYFVFLSVFHIDIIAALRSVLPGNKEERASLQETFELFPQCNNPDYITKWSANRTRSMQFNLNYADQAVTIADSLEKKAPEMIKEHKHEYHEMQKKYALMKYDY